jgi:hypothetical protein
MKLVITDTNGEQLTIATNGDKKDERQTNTLTQAGDGDKQTAQKPQEPAPAANGDKKSDPKPQESAPAADGAKQTKQKPQEPAPATNGDKKSEPRPEESSHEKIASLAERYSHERGSSQGSAEEDWLRAEADGGGKKNEQQTPPSLPDAKPPGQRQKERTKIVRF